MDYCYIHANKMGVPLRLDEGVTKDRTKLLRIPFSVHPNTMKVVVPIDPYDEFELTRVPTVE